MNKQIQKTPNPQGKGIAGVVEDIRFYKPSCVEAKDGHQWLAEYFTSVLVLGAEFSFKPALLKDYYLYFKNDAWKLSLIEPQAWKSHDPGTFFATCVLNPDMTWSLRLAHGWQKDILLQAELTSIETAFVTSLLDEKSLVDQLPFCKNSLPYYQRLCAHSLAQSLNNSLKLALGKHYRKAQGKTLLVDFKKHNSSLLESLT